MKIWPHPYPRRYWQERAEERFEIVRHQKDDFLMVACPGAGKTDGALPLVARLFESGKARRLVVVGHTDAICEQWKESALAYGLLISRAVSETKEFRGAVSLINRSSGASNYCGWAVTVRPQWFCLTRCIMLLKGWIGAMPSARRLAKLVFA